MGAVACFGMFVFILACGMMSCYVKLKAKEEDTQVNVRPKSAKNIERQIVEGVLFKEELDDLDESLVSESPNYAV